MKLAAARVVGQPRTAVLARELAAEDRADGAVDVADRELALNRLSALECRGTCGDERRHVERLRDAVVLLDHLAHSDVGAHLRAVEDLAEVEPLRLVVADGAL